MGGTVGRSGCHVTILALQHVVCRWLPITTSHCGAVLVPSSILECDVWCVTVLQWQLARMSQATVTSAVFRLCDLTTRSRDEMCLKLPFSPEGFPAGLRYKKSFHFSARDTVCYLALVCFLPESQRRLQTCHTCFSWNVRACSDSYPGGRRTMIWASPQVSARCFLKLAMGETAVSLWWRMQAGSRGTEN